MKICPADAHGLRRTNMTRFVVFFLAAVLLVAALAVPVMAEESSMLKGPEVIRSGDTFTLTFYAGDVYKGTYSGTGTVIYDTAQLTFKSYTSLLGDDWLVEFFGDTFTIENISKSNPLLENVPIFSIEFEVKPEVTVGSMVSVAVDGVYMNNGEYDIAQGRAFWARVIAEPLSANADLESLNVEGFLLSPAFDSEQKNYAVYLPNEVQSLRVTARVADYRASLVLPTIENIPVGRTTYEILVTAQNGDVKIYTITTFRAEPMQDPNEIPEETEPATEPETEPTTEPTTEATTEPTTEPTVRSAADSGDESAAPERMSNVWTGVLWIGSVIAAFVGGLVAPLLIWSRE